MEHGLISGPVGYVSRRIRGGEFVLLQPTPSCYYSHLQDCNNKSPWHLSGLTCCIIAELDDKLDLDNDVFDRLVYVIVDGRQYTTYRCNILRRVKPSEDFIAVVEEAMKFRPFKDWYRFFPSRSLPQQLNAEEEANNFDLNRRSDL